MFVSVTRSLISPVVSNASPPGAFKSSFPPCRMPRDPMSVPNFGVALTPVEATKLVYLEGEEAPSPRVEIDHDFGAVHMRFHPNGPSSGGPSLNKTLNRRSYPMTSSASARFGNPYSTPEEPGEITSGYVSIETVHQSPNGDGPMSFSNPNYMVADIQNAISKGNALHYITTSAGQYLGRGWLILIRLVRDKSYATNRICRPVDI